MNTDGDEVNLPSVTAADLRDRSERASRRLDDLFRLSALVHTVRTGTDHPVVAAALGMVADSLTDQVPEVMAVAEYAREAAVTGALVGAPPAGDELASPTLTVADLKARTVRADAAADAAGRTVDLVAAMAAEATDPVVQRAWWELYDTANAEYERARQASRRAWDRYSARRDADDAPGPAGNPEPPDSACRPGEGNPSDP